MAVDRWTMNPTAAARHAEVLVIDQDRTLTYNSIAIRNSEFDPVDVKVRFSDTQLDFTYRNIQPGATEVCRIDKIYFDGTTAETLDVLY